ncbi:site-specific recombinase XerD [Kushneria sinocarnis]|uniref:Site-specific recombinase XerD n=1 Tax=Kushneria sinocarnis TaxID=595502 RepID=A0A420WYA0_9GAMM|nr:site-specific integrase [Kushneria sinocarnis]RKR06204.1 site-specific recombinase XerD [Kushneria sinocarnis]
MTRDTETVLVTLTEALERQPSEAASPPGNALIAAGSDAEAVAQWLGEYRHSPQTFRHYRKESERLLLWLASRGRHLHELRRDELDDFEAFLADPQPRERWVGPPRPRQSPAWRPFRQPLSAASRRQALVILQGMMAWLVEAGWLTHNPFRLMRNKRQRMDNRHGRVERYLERPLWQWLWQHLSTVVAEQTMRQRFEQARLRFTFAFAYLLGPRISEMARARMNDFFCREGQWWWQVTGKGARTSRVPVTPALVRELTEWRSALGLSGTPQPGEDTPLIRALNGRRGITDNQLYRLIRGAFSQAARALESDADSGLPAAGRQRMAEQLRQATPHWLRHTAITHQAQQGVELRYLASTARHARLETTARYLHEEDLEWHAQMQRHTLSSKVPNTADEPDDGTL